MDTVRMYFWILPSATEKQGSGNRLTPDLRLGDTLSQLVPNEDNRDR